MMKPIITIIFFVGFINFNNAQINALKNTKWKLIRYTNTAASTSFNLITYDFSMRFDSMKVYLKVCNQLSAKYSITGNQITFKSLFGTKSICDDKISNTEYAVMDNFNTMSYKFNSDSLILTNDKTKQDYFFIKEK
jgi:heat shock protein HslJ